MLDPMPRQDMRNPPTLSEARLLTRIEGLEELLWAAENDAKEAEAYAGELEEKLAKAEWLLVDATVQLEEGKIKTRRNRAALIRQFLAELTGGKEYIMQQGD